jgi:hypothetical protein
MAQITINEISQNYTYNIGSNAFATVALPITAMWGPAYMEPATIGVTKDEMLEMTTWNHFPATQSGLESFVATYRGPASNFRMYNDYSYQMAMTLLTAGYDVLVCRVCPGTLAQGTLIIDSGMNTPLAVSAKYPGTFGNQIRVTLKKVTKKEYDSVKKTYVELPYYWNAIVYVCDSSGVQTAVENLIFVFDINNSTDNIPHISEVESKFITFAYDNITSDNQNPADDLSCYLAGGTDNINSVTSKVPTDAVKGVYNGQEKWFTPIYKEPANWNTVYTDTVTFVGYADATNEPTFVTTSAGSQGKAPEFREGVYYNKLEVDVSNEFSTELTKIAVIRYGDEKANYVVQLKNAAANISDITKLTSFYHMEWIYNAACDVYDLLKDKLNYNPQRIISPGWDDQDYLKLTGDYGTVFQVSPIHQKILEVSYYSRCAAGMIDIPRSCPRRLVYNDDVENPGYAQMLSRNEVPAGGNDVNAVLFNTHCALFAPWGQYKYVGMGKQCIAPPALLALLIQRAMILNQSLQYEWALPTNRTHNLNIGKMDYKVPKKLLDIWQKLEGVGVNVITEIPELGLSIWGNSTLYEVPPATYQALANLSTRFLVNAVEDIAYKCGLAITFQYNNEQAYNKFYAGVTPTLDTMKNVGAIDDYYVKMAADINGLDQVNANTVIGKIYLVINGVINDIIIDLIALPPGTDLNQYRS